MRSRFLLVLGLVFACPSITLGADPVMSAPASERVDAPSPVVESPAQAINEQPKAAEKSKPVEKPRLVEKPKPAEKPHLAAENTRPAEVVSIKPIEPPVPAVVPAPADNGTAGQEETKACYSIGCLGLSFAMLIIGIAAGFLGRHLLSRHKLGGMTVRIGTWRGIP